MELGLPDFMQHFDKSDYGHLTTALQGVALMFVAIGGVVPMEFMDPVIAVLNDSSPLVDLRRHFDVGLVNFALTEALMSFSSVVTNVDSDSPTSPAHRFFNTADSTTAVIDLLVRRLIQQLEKSNLVTLQPSLHRLLAARDEERALSKPPVAKKPKVEDDKKDSALPRSGLCVADAFYFFEIEAANGKVPTGCPRGAACKYFHASEIFRKKLKTEVVKYITDMPKDAIKDAARAKFLSKLAAMSKVKF